MTTYTDSDVRQKLETVLDAARSEGEVRIKRSDGEEFVLRPVSRDRSPLDVGSVDVKLTTAEIVDSVRESRKR